MKLAHKTLIALLCTHHTTYCKWTMLFCLCSASISKCFTAFTNQPSEAPVVYSLFSKVILMQKKSEWTTDATEAEVESPTMAQICPLLSEQENWMCSALTEHRNTRQKNKKTRSNPSRSLKIGAVSSVMVLYSTILSKQWGSVCLHSDRSHCTWSLRCSYVTRSVTVRDPATRIINITSQRIYKHSQA